MASTSNIEARRLAVVPCHDCGKLSRVDLDRIADRPKCGSCSAPLALDQPVMLNDSNFDRVIRDAPVPVIVDFYADWCGPCRAMAPAYAQLAQRNAGNALVAKLDTDRSQQVAQRFSIGGIPTVIVFRGGREVKRQVGAVPLPALESLLRSA